MATSSEGATNEMATGTEHIVQPVAIQALTCGMPLPQFLYEGRGRSRSVGERQWTRVRAVMAWYTRLRRIKRTKSSQRWMKLRTTVQLTSAITTSAQSKKSSLKREDSFLKRFSTRQLPEIQETFDCTDEGGSSSGGGGGGADGAQEALPRRRRSRHVRPPRSVLNPDENGLFYWLGFLSLWVLYNFWTIIVRLAFPELHNNAGFTAWNICDALGDAAYVVDILAQFRTGYLEQGIMVHDSKKLSVHYLRSRAFLVDLAALVPLDWFLLAQIQPNSDDVLIRWRPALRLFRMVKIYRVWSFYYVVESRTVYPNAWRVINLIHILLLLAHWFGCFYFLISESEGFRSDWSYPYPEGDFASITRKYLASLYWSTLTLTTIGDLPTPESNSDKRPRHPVPLLRSSREVSATLVADLLDSGSLTNASFPAALIDDKSIQALPRRGLKSRLLHHVTNQGYVFTIASYLIGVFIFATIVGQVGNVITNRNASRLEFERLLDSAKLYMRHHKVPRSMQRRVQRWYDYSWSRGRIQGSGGDANTALRILPDKLKTELALHVNLSTLKKVSIFKECQPEFLHDLVLKMRSSIFTPGDMVCRRGEVAREMFIIADGILEVISETGKVLTTMKAGDFFGEIGILNLDGLNKRTADVRSVGYSELFSLSREHVLSAMKDYPEAEDILLNLGRKRLLEARKAASQHRAQMARKALLALEVKGQQQRNQTDEGNAATKLADKLRNDVKGFTNALRKSFREPRRRTRSTSPEEMELGLLNASPEVSERRKTSGSASLTSSGSRAVLKRMPRVNSSETTSNDEDHSLTQPLLHQQEPPHEVIGAGLPLLQRLKLLRQKEQEQERQQQQQVKLNNTLTIPSNAKEEKQLKHISFVEESVSKSKKVDSNESSPKARWTLAVIPRSSGLKNQTGNQLKPPLDVIHSCSSYESTEKPVAVASEPKSKAVSQTVQGKPALSLSPISNMPILRKRLYRKQHTISSDGDFRQSRRKIRSESMAPTKSVPAKRCLRQQTIQIVTDVESVLTDIMQDVLPAAQKDAILSREPNKLFISSGNINTLTKPPEGEPKPSPPLQVRSVDRPRKLRLLKRGSKNYASIDDLSPEYTVLPFVKRLKILNERQKIAELERQLTGAVSEKKDPAPEEKSEKSGASPLNSPESNETPERRSLKKILKQLSRTCSENLDQNNKTKLMRSQTVEGYAARHSNFTTLCRRDKQRYGPAQENETKEEEETKESRGMCEEKKKSSSSKESSFLGEEARGKLIRAFGEEEYVSELLIGIKQVLQERLKDIQMRFQVRIDQLEQQLEQKDAVINQLHEQLRNRSGSLENLSKKRSKQMEEEFSSQENAEPEISESSSPEEEMEDHVASYFARSIPRGSLVNTASQLPVTRSLAPAENLLERETEETQGLPQALNPQPLWQLEFGSCWQRMENPVNITNNPRDLILDLESDLETASSSEEEYSGKCQVRDHPEEPYVPDWEVQMLAQVMEQDKIELPSTADEKSKSSVKLRNRKFGSLSLDQTSSGTKSRRQLEKWFQSYPPPLSATLDHGNSSKFSDFPVIEEDEPLP